MSLALATPNGVIVDSQGTDTSKNTYSTMEPKKVTTGQSLAIGAVGSWAGVEAMHESAVTEEEFSGPWRHATRVIRDSIRREVERISGEQSTSGNPRFVGVFERGLFIINHDLAVVYPESNIAAVGEGHKAAKVLAEEKIALGDGPLPPILAETMATIAREFTTVGGPFYWAEFGGRVVKMECSADEPEIDFFEDVGGD